MNKVAARRLDTPRTLEAAVEQLIELGSNDPIDIARKIERNYGEAWLAEQLAAHAGDIVAEFARQALNRRRNSSLRPARAIDSAFLLHSKWVPGEGWKPLGNLTADDCRAIANHYRMLSRAAAIRANLFDGYAQLIEFEGVERLGEVRAALPSLEEEED